MRVAIIEPYLLDNSGHYLNFVTDLKYGFEQSGYQADIYVPENCICVEQLLKEYPIPMPSLEGMGIFKKLAMHFSYIFKIRKFLTKIAKENYDIIFLTSANYWGTLFASAMAEFNRPLFLYLHNVNIIFSSRNGFLKFFIKALLGDKKGFIRFLTPGDVSEEEFRRSVLDIGGIFIAGAPYVQREPISEEQQCSAGEEFIISYLGDARKEKGFLDVCAFVEMYWAKYKFLIQVTVPSESCEEGVAKKITQLEGLQSANVLIIDKPQTYNDYLFNIKKSDIVLLLYDSAMYANRFSGVLLEAFYLGKPVITTQGSWLAEQVEKYGGGIVINNPNPQTLDQAVENIRVDYPSFCNQAAEAGRKLYAQNNGIALAELAISTTQEMTKVVNR